MNAIVSLGSFAAPGLNGPFSVNIHWGDGTPDILFQRTSAGAIPAQHHKFAGSETYDVIVAVTDGAGHLSNGADDEVKVTAAPLQTLVVNTINDQTDPASSATVSLRDAVTRADAALGPVNITFSPTVFATSKTITLVGNSGLNLQGDPYGIITVIGSSAGVTLDLGSSGLQVLGTQAAALLNLTITAGAGNFDYLANYGSMTLHNSTVSNLGQGLYNTGTLTLTDSTISGNSSSGFGSIANKGVATLNDCTIVGNTDYGIENYGTASVSDCTIAGNSRAGINNTRGGTLTLSNSIVADSTPEYPGAYVIAVNGPINSLGHNLIDTKDDSTGWISSDLTGTVAHPLDPKLSPLGHYGGPTQTQFPLPGSPALNAGSISLVPSGVTTDQRGFSRIVAGKVDIGAFQSQSATAIKITPPAAQTRWPGLLRQFRWALSATLWGPGRSL